MILTTKQKLLITLISILLMFATGLLVSLTGCSSRTIAYSNVDEYQPFSGLNISITTTYNYSNFTGDAKNFKCVATFVSTDDLSYHIELWTRRYRGADSLVKEFDLKNKQSYEYKHQNERSMSLHYQSPFYRIECYVVKDGKIKHQTIFYARQRHSKRKK